MLATYRRTHGIGRPHGHYNLANIQGWRSRPGHEHEQAWRLLAAENQFPAIRGQVC